MGLMIGVEISFLALGKDKFDEYLEKMMTIAKIELGATGEIDYSIQVGEETIYLNAEPTAEEIAKTFSEYKPMDKKVTVFLEDSDDKPTVPEPLKGIDFTNIQACIALPGRDLTVTQTEDQTWKWESCGDFFIGYSEYGLSSEEEAIEIAKAKLESLPGRIKVAKNMFPRRHFGDNYRDYLDRYKEACDYVDQTTDDTESDAFIATKAIAEGFTHDEVVLMIGSNSANYTKKVGDRFADSEAMDRLDQLVGMAAISAKIIRKKVVNRDHLVFVHRWFWEILSAHVLSTGDEIEGGILSGIHDTRCVEVAHRAGMQRNDAKMMVCSNSKFLRGIYLDVDPKDWIKADLVAKDMLDHFYGAGSMLEMVFKQETIELLKNIATTQPAINGFIQVFDKCEDGDVVDLIDSLIKNLLSIERAGDELMERFSGMALDCVFKDLKLPGTKDQFRDWCEQKDAAKNN